MRYLTCGIFRGCCTPFPGPAAFSCTREDSSIFAPVSSASPWPRQQWNGSSVELSVVYAVRPPLDVFPLTQGKFTLPSSTMYILHAWTLLGTCIEDRDPLTVLLASWLIRYGFKPLWSTTESGLHSVLGVQRDRLILFLFL